jgi:hypothetical protein
MREGRLLAYDVGRVGRVGGVCTDDNGNFCIGMFSRLLNGWEYGHTYWWSQI